MRTSFTVLALLGVTGLGSMQAQANDQLLADMTNVQYGYADEFEVENQMTSLFGFDEDEDDEENRTSDQLPIPEGIDKRLYLKQMMGQMVLMIKQQSDMVRGLLKECIQISKDEKLVANSQKYGVDLLKLQYDIMDVGAASFTVAHQLSSAGRLVKYMNDYKRQVLVFKKLLDMFKSTDEAAEKLRANKLYHKIEGFVNSDKNDEAEKDANDTIVAKNKSKISANEKAMAKILSYAKNLSMNVENGEHIDSEMKKACSGENLLDCKKSMEIYQSSRTQKINRAYQNYTEKVGENDQLNAENKELMGDSSGSAAKNAFKTKYSKLVDIGNSYFEVSQEVVHDIQDFMAQKPQTDVIDVNQKAYKALQTFGQETADLSNKEFKKVILKSMERAWIGHACAQQEVQYQVDITAGKRPHKPRKQCKSYLQE